MTTARQTEKKKSKCRIVKFALIQHNWIEAEKKVSSRQCCQFDTFILRNLIGKRRDKHLSVCVYDALDYWKGSVHNYHNYSS